MLGKGRASIALSGILLSVACALASPAGYAYGNASDLDAMIADGVQLLRDNRNAEAAAQLKRAVVAYPNSAQAHHDYGLALAKLGDTDDAIVELQSATRLKPSQDASWLTLGGLQQSTGKVEDAIATYKKFLQLFEHQRPDLNETVAKVHKLVDALNSEAGSIRTYQAGTQAMRSSALLQAPAQPVTDDDYLGESTRNGVVRWPSSRMPIPVFIQPTDSKRLPGYKAQWRNILVRSFQDWAAASNGTVSFVFVSKETPDGIHCSFVADGGGDGSLASNAEAGEAKMFVDEQGIRSGSIALAVKSMSSVLPLTDNRMRVACLHEIGHALGLAGHTTNPDDIMFYSSSFKDEWRDLNGRDARTIQRLYAPN